MTTSYDTIFANVPGGSDIDLSVRYKLANSYPDISDTVMRVVGTLDGSPLFDIISNDLQPGSKVEVTSDSTGDVVKIHIDGNITVGLTGTIQLASVLESAETGRRTEVGGSILLGEGGGL